MAYSRRRRSTRTRSSSNRGRRTYSARPRSKRGMSRRASGGRTIRIVVQAAPASTGAIASPGQIGFKQVAPLRARY